MADAPGGGELEGQQGQDAAGGRDGCGAGVARRVHQGRQVEGDQVGNGQQQPGEPGVGPAREGGEVDDAGPGQVGVAASGGRADAGFRRGAAQQPAEALLGQDLADPGAVQRGPLGGQPGADLIDRQALPAQLGHAPAGSVLPRRAFATGPARLGEQDQLARAEVADQRGQRRAGVTEPRGGLVQGGSLM